MSAGRGEDRFAKQANTHITWNNTIPKITQLEILKLSSHSALGATAGTKMFLNYN